MPSPFLEAASNARHDLGKYIAFELRWVGEAGEPADLLAALQSDVLRTRSADGLHVDAVGVWEQVRGGFRGMEDKGGHVRAVTEAMERIRLSVPGLREGDLSADELRACAADALIVSDQLDALYRRLKEE